MAHNKRIAKARNGIDREKLYTLAFLLTAIPLFLGGCWLAWWSLPNFVHALLSMTPAGSANLINANEYILFTIRILLVFGIAFVLPVVLVLLNFAGLLTTKNILNSWRIAVFVIALIAALFGFGGIAVDLPDRGRVHRRLHDPRRPRFARVRQRRYRRRPCADRQAHFLQPVLGHHRDRLGLQVHAGPGRAGDADDLEARHRVRAAPRW